MAETKKQTRIPKDRVRERANADNEAMAKLYGWDGKSTQKKPTGKPVKKSGK